jgi:CAAX protease family protein
MKATKAFVVQHPVVTYFVMTFAISWGGVLLAIGGPAGMRGVKAQDSPLFPLVLLAMVAGPTVAGLALTGFIDGRPGMRELRSRLLTWRVEARWYAAALLAAPLLAMAARFALSFVSHESGPRTTGTDVQAGVLMFGAVVGLIAGFFEELGWTGFATPRLLRRYGVLATGLIVGLLWSAWHFLVVAWGIGDRAGSIPVAVFIVVDGLAGLPAFRVLMVWVYDRTGSLFAATLMHFSLTATTLILTPRTIGILLLAYGVTFAAAVWLVLAGASASRRSWR